MSAFNAVCATEKDLQMFEVQRKENKNCIARGIRGEETTRAFCRRKCDPERKMLKGEKKGAAGKVGESRKKKVGPSARSPAHHFPG